MGVILDSSVLIAGERRRESVREILKRVQAAQGEVESALSVVTIVELTHGIYRARSDADRDRRRAFSDDAPGMRDPPPSTRLTRRPG